jgi:O-antigen/teichoic acid export membrane protein
MIAARVTDDAPPTPPPPEPRAAPSHRQISRGVAWTGAAQAVIAIADLISQMLVIALWVPAHEYGIAMMAYAWFSLLDTAADMGVASALIQKDDHSPDKLSTVFWLNLFISLGLFLALCGLGPLYGWFQGHSVVGWMLIAYGGKLLIQNGYSIPLALLRKELRFDEVAKIRTAAHLSESLGRVVFAAIGWTLWCFILAAMVRAVMFAAVMQIRHPFRPRLVFRPREIKEYVKFGLRSAASGILYQLYTNLDYAIVGKFFGGTALGIYHLAYSIVLEPVRTITNVVSEVAFPTFARLRFDRERLIDQLIRFTRLNLVAVLPFLVVIWLIIPDLLLLFASGDKWTPAQLELVADCVRVLCFVGILRPLGFLGPPLLDGLGHPERTLRYMIVTAILMPAAYIVASVVLRDYGPIAVAIGWSVGYPFAFGWLGYLVYRTTQLPVGRYVRGASGILACGLAGWATGYALVLALPDAMPTLRSALIGGVAVAVLAATLAVWQGITPRSIKQSMG